MRDYCDLDPCDFYTERLVRARTPHRCCETHRLIATGEWYWRITMKCDGSITSYAQSWGAYRLARALNYNDGNGACWIPFGGLGEEVQNAEYFGDDPGPVCAEWEMVRAGIITREPVGDELEYLASRGIAPPPVDATALVNVGGDA